MRRFGAVLGAAVLLAGGAWGASAAEETTGVTETSVKIGMFFVLTGPASPYGVGTRNSAQLVIDEVNKAGGIHGRKIEAIIEDDGCAGSKAVASAQKLINRDQVFALYGGNCSAATVNVVPLANEHRIPFYVPMAVSKNITNPFSRYVFRSNIMSTMEGTLIVDFAMDRYKPKRVAILHSTDEYGTEVHGPMAPRLKSKHGMDPVAIVGHKLGETDLSAQVLKLKEAKPDAVLMATYLRDASIFLRQARELGLDAKFVGSIAASNPIMDQLAGKEAVWGRYAAITPLIDDPQGPRLAPFVKQYCAVYTEHCKRPGIPGIYDGQGYGSIQIFLEGLRRAGRNLTREGLIRALETVKDFPTNAYAPVSFSPTDHDGVQGAYFYDFTADGKRVFLDQYYLWKGTWRPGK